MGVSRLLDEDQDPERSKNPDRQIDVENPAPIVVVSQPAAERRADNRAQYDSHAPDRHRVGVSVWWVDLQKHCLRQRDECRAADALQQAVDHELSKARRHPA